MENKIKTIIVKHKDRFIRFGYERFLSKFDVKIVIVNNENLSPQEELVQNILSIPHVFSCRIYGLRKYKKRIKGGGEIEKSLQSRNQSNRESKTENETNDWCM